VYSFYFLYAIQELDIHCYEADWPANKRSVHLSAICEQIGRQKVSIIARKKERDEKMQHNCETPSQPNTTDSCTLCPSIFYIFFATILSV